MAFNALLWSFSKKENSTARPVTSQAVTVQCVTNDDFDLVSPTLIFNFNGGASNPTQYNYCYLGEYKRYYWIDSWSFTGGQWVAYCSVDVLASWKTEIGQQTVYVLRSASEWDGDIVDTTYPATSDVTVSCVSNNSPWDSDGYYVVGFVSSGGLTQYAKLDPSEFVQFGQTVFSDSFAQNTIGTDLGLDLVKSIIDPMQYIVSVMWIPLQAGGGGRGKPVKLGWWDTGISGVALDAGSKIIRTVTFNIPKHPQAASRGAYLNTAPYSEYVLDIKPWGRIVLDPAHLRDDSVLEVVYSIDLVTGSGVLWAVTDEARICLSVAQVGVPVQVSQVLHNYSGMITGAVGAIAGAAAGNVIGAAAGIGNMIGNAFPTANVQGVNGGRASLSGTWQLNAKFYNIVNEDLQDRGRPLCQRKRINTLSGFVQVQDADIALPATQNEQNAIRAYMEGGFFYA